MKTVIATIEKSQWPPVVNSKPVWRRLGPIRQNLTSDIFHFRVLGKRAFDDGDPVVRHYHVIIREGDDVSSRCGDPGITPVCDALFALKNIAEVGVSFSDKGLNRRPCVIGRVVVDEDDFVAHTSGVLAKQRFQRRSQHFRSVKGGYDSRYVKMLIHTV